MKRLLKFFVALSLLLISCDNRTPEKCIVIDKSYTPSKVVTMYNAALKTSTASCKPAIYTINVKCYYSNGDSCTKYKKIDKDIWNSIKVGDTLITTKKSMTLILR